MPTYSVPSDADWLAEIYRRCRDDVYRYIRTWAVSPAAAEDFVSETFLRAAKNVVNLKQRQDSVVPWLFRVAKNVILDDRKSAYTRRRASVTDVPELPADQESFEDRLVRKWLVGEVSRCLCLLNQAQRHCLELRFGDGLSVAETAVAMDKTENAVKQLQHRAIGKLGLLLAERTGEAGLAEAA
ncbi:sigma-70 family RNA polymerase sigma factor [Amycolatopsis sp. K13G38]|uniref:Sigma-70 family RNA polymerase sigma factor n=1 Tax=Amycolatopsis acididurans TaxID=2724524 RepID=A0ABX1J6P4_9PSEU|nr:sigma-70 family RNA polymerase sigma factor [Amycolatopsis acididurans]NKQ55485.1 sigma-70 family RNA polymerase sigma factor [Amycolatopsis acididurans]